MIVIGLVIETQAAIRRSREQKDASTLPRLRIKQAPRQVSRVRIFIKQMLEALKLIQDD